MSYEVQDALAKYFGFNTQWAEWADGGACEFATRYCNENTYQSKVQEQASVSVSIDDLLAGLSLWVGQEVFTSHDGARLWPVSFEFRSQPSSELLNGVRLALKRIKIFFFATSKSTSKPLWRESYPAIYQLEASNVVLYAFGNNIQRGQIVEAKPGCFIGAVDPPHDFFRVSGLDEESVIVAYATAYSKDLAEIEQERETGPSDEALADANYSFVRVQDGKAVKPLSVEQERLLKVLTEKERQHSMGAQRPKLGPGWVLLSWAQRHPLPGIVEQKD